MLNVYVNVLDFSKLHVLKADFACFFVSSCGVIENSRKDYCIE